MGTYMEASVKYTSQRREELQHKHPCLTRDSNPDLRAPQLASLITIPHGRLWSLLPCFIFNKLTCRNCGGGDRGRVAIYRPFGELCRAEIVLSPVWCSRLTTGVPLAHATMDFVGLDLTTSDRWHQTTTTSIANIYVK
ncbi:hypothetical protein TNCV_2667141 [Trichonephila clavipes]|nr:hypothetical protein TNCV_2667141 [Trichonephila clavipes]